MIGIVADLVGELCREDPVLPVIRNGAADHLFGFAAIISVGRVDKIDAGLARLRHDARRGRLIRRPAEHHGAQTNRRNFQATAAELAVLHGLTSWLSFRGDAKASNPESRDSGSGPSDHPGMTISTSSLRSH